MFRILLGLGSILVLTACGSGNGGVTLNGCSPSPIMYTSTAGHNADAAAFRAKFQSGAAVHLTILGDSTTMGYGAGMDPNAVQLLDTYVKGINPLSAATDNYGISPTFSQYGLRASDYVRLNAMASIAGTSPKPDAVVIALGINDIGGRTSEMGDLKTLIAQARQYGMLPILAHENNVACPIDINKWTPLVYWKFVRSEVEQTGYDTQVDVIDLGTPDGAVDPALMHDFVHPNGGGYFVIAARYETWLSMP